MEKDQQKSSTPVQQYNNSIVQTHYGTSVENETTIVKDNKCKRVQESLRAKKRP